eukprot:scaffold3362_cov154-Amphora_coffeaeformis.AAC.5
MRGSALYGGGRTAMGPRLLTMARSQVRQPASRKYLIKRTFFFGSSKSSSQGNGGGFFKNRRFAASDVGLQWTAPLSDPKEVVPVERGLPSRSEQVRRLKGESADCIEEYDVLVIGGGATGAGVALDAATRGFKVACVERGDFASETSSRSTKLLWAGIKYMGSAFAFLLTPENYRREGFSAVLERFWSEMKMVYHCHVERHYMATVNRHLCDWVAIAVPFTKWYKVDKDGRYPLKHWLFAFFPSIAPVVMKFYDSLSGFSCPPSYILSASKAKSTFPQLKQDYEDGQKLKYCSVFYEAQHNDARTNLAIALTAASKGAHICNYVEAVELITENKDSKVVVGARVRDRMTGDEWTVRAKEVVLAGGPFTDSLRRMEHDAVEVDNKKGEQDTFTAVVSGAAGSHIVLPRKYLPDDIGMLDVQTSDNRFMFILPWQGHTLVGTTDSPSLAQTLPQAPEDEIDWLLREAQTYLKKDESLTWDRSEVLSAWRGWRPLAVDPHAAGGQVSRDHVISFNPESRVFFIAGGKWTTWREMANDIVDRVAAKLVNPGENPPSCVTKSVILWGGERGFSDNLTEQLLELYPDMEKDVAVHLTKTYGGHVWDLCRAATTTGDNTNTPFYKKRLVPDYAYIEAEIPFACQEYACTVEDILSRRTRLAYLNRSAALQALPRVADLLQETLGWTSKVKKAQIEAGKRYVESFGGPVPHTAPPPAVS